MFPIQEDKAAPSRLLIHLERQDPDRASAFHRLICRLLAERLTRTINTLQALLR